MSAEEVCQDVEQVQVMSHALEGAGQQAPPRLHLHRGGNRCDNMRNMACDDWFEQVPIMFTCMEGQVSRHLHGNTCRGVARGVTTCVTWHVTIGLNGFR
jgi:hypothetical protein